MFCYKISWIFDTLFMKTFYLRNDVSEDDRTSNLINSREIFQLKFCLHLSWPAGLPPSHIRELRFPEREGERSIFIVNFFELILIFSIQLFQFRTLNRVLRVSPEPGAVWDWYPLLWCYWTSLSHLNILFH